PSRPVTLYLLIGTLAVIVKHRSNIRRLLRGTENRIGDFPMRDTIVRGLHILALGLWFGGAAFFNFVAAVPIFESFKEVVANSPSDRTANVDIVPPGADKDALANALAGSAVGPIFPRYFALQAVCGGIALVTAFSWLKGSRGIDRLRLAVILVAVALVAV